MNKAYVLLLILSLAVPATALQINVLSKLWEDELLPELFVNIQPKEVYIGDIDQDGFGEVIVATSGITSTSETKRINRIYAYSSGGAKKWSYGLDDRLMDIQMKDINNDFKMEFVISSGKTLNRINRGQVRTLSSTGDLMQSVESTSIYKKIVLGDVERDRAYELAGASEQRFYLMKSYGKKIWEFPAYGEDLLNRTVGAIAMGDVTGDDFDEVIGGSERIYITDRKGNMLGSIDPEPLEEHGKKGYTYVAVADLSDSTYNDILAVSNLNRIYGLRIHKISKQKEKDVITNISVSWVYDQLPCKIIDIDLLDIDADPYSEIILACTDNRIYAIDHNGAKVWDYPLDGLPSDITITDMNGDGIKDILAASNLGSIYLLDGSGAFQWKYETEYPITMLGAGHLGPDDQKEIAVLTEYGKLVVYGINDTYSTNREAYTQYNLGQQRYLEGDYEASLNYFIEAKKIFLRLGDERMIQTTQDFITKLNQAMSQNSKEQADLFLAKAKDYFFEENYENSKIFAQKSLQIYEAFQDQEGILNCQLLLLQIERQEKLFSTMTTLKPLPLSTLPEPEDQSGYNIYIILFFVVAAAIIFIIAKKKNSALAAGAKKPPRGMDGMGDTGSWGEIDSPPMQDEMEK